MATVTKIASKIWRVRYDEYIPETGKRVQHSKTFTRAADANAFKVEVEADEVVVPSCERSFTAYVDEWWPVYQATLEASTIKGYNRIIKRLKAYFGMTLMSSITATKIQKLYALLQRPDNGLTKEPLSPATVHRHHAVLRSIFSAALIDKVIKVNPMPLVKVPREITDDIELPDITDVQQQLSSLRGKTTFVGAAIAYYAGLRLGEILGLKWADINLSARTIDVCRVRQRYTPDCGELNTATRFLDLPCRGKWIERDYPKSKRARKFVMPPELVDILKAERRTQLANRVRLGTSYVDTDFVCVHDDGMPIGDAGLSKCMKGLCRFHDLRHVNVSYMLDAGVPVVEVARRAGHTTPTTTLKIYAHVVKHQDEDAAAALENVLGHV